MNLFNFYKESKTYKDIIRKGYENENESELILYMSSNGGAGDAEEDYVEDKNGIYYRHVDNRGDHKTKNQIKRLGLNEKDYLDIKFKRIAHIENIQNDRVFGSNGDVIALSYLLGKNTIVIVEDRENKNYHRVTPFILNDRYDETIYLLLSGEAHYDILVPHVPRTTSPRSNRETRKSRTPSPKPDDLVNAYTRKRKSKSPTSKSRKYENKLKKLSETRKRLNKSIPELEQIINDFEAEKNNELVSELNNELNRQKIELKQIEKEINKMSGTKFNILNEISNLFTKLTFRK